MPRVFKYSRSDWEEDLSHQSTDSGGVLTVDSSGRLEAVAQEVANSKAQAVCEAMILIGAVRGLNTPANATRRDIRMTQITCSAAAVQDVRAQSLSFEQQAAHLLPGQIRADGQLIWNLAESWERQHNQSPRISLGLREAFCKTCVLPAAFNRADSQAERSSNGVGLKSLFAESVTVMWQQARSATTPTQLDQVTVDRLAINAGLRHYFQHMSSVYEAAMDRKLDAYDAATSAQTEERRFLESRVLSEYERSFKINNPLRLIDCTPSLRSVIGRFQQLY